MSIIQSCSREDIQTACISSPNCSENKPLKARFGPNHSPKPKQNTFQVSCFRLKRYTIFGFYSSVFIPEHLGKIDTQGKSHPLVYSEASGSPWHLAHQPQYLPFTLISLGEEQV